MEEFIIHAGNEIMKQQQSQILRCHVEAINEIVCYSCSQCYYKATRNDSLKKYVELIHEGGFYSCSLCAYKATNKGHVMSSLFIKAKN